MSNSVFAEFHRSRYINTPVCSNLYDVELRHKRNADGSLRKEFTLFNVHMHTALELIHVIDGSFTLTLNGVESVVSAGELLIFNPFDQHGGFLNKNTPKVTYVYVIIELDELKLGDPRCAKHIKKLADSLTKCRNRPCIDADERVLAQTSAVCEMLDRVEKCYASQSGNGASELELYGLVFSLLGRLLDAGIIEQASPDAARQNTFIRKIFDFLENNYDRQITPELLWSEFPYTRSYFCRLFKRNFGKSFSNYLCEYRIKKAVSEYLDADEHQPISEIASRVGFVDYCYFTRAFKKIIGCPPSEYRKSRSSSKPNLK